MKHFLHILFAFAGISSFSQISYTSANHASGAYSQQMTYVTIGLNSINFAAVGSNTTWDYSSLAKNTWYDKKTVTPSASGYQAPYIAQCIAGGGGFTCLTRWNTLTNTGMLDADSLNAFVVTIYDVMTMVNKTSTNLIGTVKGLKVKDSTGVSVPLVTEYTDHDTILDFPFTYQDSGKSNGQWEMDLNSFGQNIQYKAIYTREYEVEGWGKLITPHATYNNTLKVKTVINQTDSVYFLGTPYGIERTMVEYAWYDAAFGLPVMIAEGNEVAGFIGMNSVSYIDNVYVGTEERELTKFNLFPNPTLDLITINNASNARIGAYKILDMQGRIVQQNSFYKTISVSELETGTYFIQLFSENKIIGIEKFVKE